MKSDHDKKDSLDESLDELETFLKAYRDDQDKKMAPTLSKEAGIHFWNELKYKAKKANALRFIVVGDNPGKEEYGDDPDDTKSNGKKDKQNKQDKQDYFCGSTRYIRNFMNKWAKEEKIFYWNKTPFVTPRTKGLQEFLSKNKALFEESQKNNGKVSGWPGPEITSRYLDCRV